MFYDFTKLRFVNLIRIFYQYLQLKSIHILFKVPKGYYIFICKFLHCNISRKINYVSNFWVFLCYVYLFIILFTRSFSLSLNLIAFLFESSNILYIIFGIYLVNRNILVSFPLLF